MLVDPPSTRDQLLALLRDGKALPPAEVSAHFDISARHARRLVRPLRDAGVPSQEDEQGRTKTFYLPGAALEIEDAPVPLTERQVLAMVAAPEAGRAALKPTPVAEQISRVAHRVAARYEA